MPAREIFISVDIEASGPIPGEYSMLSLGACVVFDVAQTFYIELKPITEQYIPEAVAVSGLDLATLTSEGVDPTIAMAQFVTWIKTVSAKGRPVFVAFNATFDWMFTSYYLHRFAGHNPFGISGLDIKAYYMGKFGTAWGQTTKAKIPRKFHSPQKHTHHALDDAIEQSQLFYNIMQELIVPE